MKKLYLIVLLGFLIGVCSACSRSSVMGLRPMEGVRVIPVQLDVILFPAYSGREFGLGYLGWYFIRSGDIWVQSMEVGSQLLPDM